MSTAFSKMTLSRRKAFSRRDALRSLGIWAGASPMLQAPLLHAQALQFQGEAPKLIGEPAGRIAPYDELVNTFEVEAMAQRLLPSQLYSKIEGSDRKAFDRMTFRAMPFVNVTKLDISVDLFGAKMLAPILVGPASRLDRFHPEGELALVQGAAAAQAAVVVSGRCSQPIEKIAAGAKTPLWYQVYPEADMAPVLARVQQAVKAGCKAVCLTVGTPYLPPGANGAPSPAKVASLGNPRLDWAVLDQVRQATGVPVLVKGIMNAEEGRVAVEKGASGVIVSNHGGRFLQGLAAPIEVLGEIVDAVAGRAPVLVDSNFRRGTDIVKALALGARGVLATRPVLWGLAAYGANGVRVVLEILQNETARTMGLCGRPNLAAVDRNLVRMHRRG